MPRAEQKSEQLQFPCEPKFSGASTSAVWAGALNLGFMNTTPPNCRRIIPFGQLGVNSKGDGPRCSFRSSPETKQCSGHWGIPELLTRAGWCSCLSRIPRELPRECQAAEALRAHLRAQGTTHTLSPSYPGDFLGVSTYPAASAGFQASCISESNPSSYRRHFGALTWAFACPSQI